MEFPEHRQPPSGWVGHADNWVSSLRAHGDTSATVEHWWYLVTQFALFIRMNPEDVQTQDILAWLTRGVSTSAIRSDVNSLRSFYSWLYRDGAIKVNPMEGVPAVKRRRKKQKPAPQAAVDRGLNHTDPRVRLLVRLFCEAGLRRSEAIAARTDDLMEDLAGMSLLVHGKGDKDRMVPLSDVDPGAFSPTARLLLSWPARAYLFRYGLCPGQEGDGVAAALLQATVRHGRVEGHGGCRQGAVPPWPRVPGDDTGLHLRQRRRSQAGDRQHALIPEP